MAKLVTNCPSCDAKLQVTRLSCPGCQMQLDGHTEIPSLLHLPHDDLEFVLAFVRSSGSLKEMAKQLGQSYPTVRNRLNDVIAQLDRDEETREQKRHAILDAIAKGKINAKEGAKQLKEIET